METRQGSITSTVNKSVSQSVSQTLRPIRYMGFLANGHTQLFGLLDFSLNLYKNSNQNYPLLYHKKNNKKKTGPVIGKGQ